jgi:uncharacterized protein
MIATISIMLLVKTKIMPSAIEGIGLFADQFIKEGTIVWEYEPGLDMVIQRDRVRTLPPEAQAYLSRYGYLNSSRDSYVLCFDDAKYFNHSDSPNTRSVSVQGSLETIDIATRDILVGEELTTDYTEFDADFATKLPNIHMHSRPVRGRDIPKSNVA